MIIRAFNQFPECSGNERRVIRRPRCGHWGDGRPVDYIVAALIHDIGDGLAPYSHGSYAAAVLRPFVAWFDATVEFCERYDENCFDPGYEWLPLEHFAPAVEEVFSREPTFR